MCECIVCGVKPVDRKVEPFDRTTATTINIVCPRCGSYSYKIMRGSEFEQGWIDDFKEKFQKDFWKVSYYIRKRQNKEPVIIDFDVLEDFIENGAMPNHREQADNLLIWLGDNTFYNQEYSFKNHLVASIVGVRDTTDIEFIAKCFY